LKFYSILLPSTGFGHPLPSGMPAAIRYQGAAPTIFDTCSEPPGPTDVPTLLGSQWGYTMAGSRRALASNERTSVELGRRQPNPGL